MSVREVAVPSTSPSHYEAEIPLEKKKRERDRQTDEQKTYKSISIIPKEECLEKNLHVQLMASYSKMATRRLSSVAVVNLI